MKALVKFQRDASHRFANMSRNDYRVLRKGQLQIRLQLLELQYTISAVKCIDWRQGFKIDPQTLRLTGFLCEVETARHQHLDSGSLGMWSVWSSSYSCSIACPGGKVCLSPLLIKTVGAAAEILCDSPVDTAENACKRRRCMQRSKTESRVHMRARFGIMVAG